jgi:3-isopropylmalate/(R)-2-methylmalate dehydratase small subunit
MHKFQATTSLMIPLPLDDIDTDLIIPAQYLTGTGRQGYGENLFRRLRDADSNFVFNLDQYAKSTILLSGKNFGCGSSREHAVWALQDFGIKVVIAESFADIFAENSAKNGLVLVRLPAEEVHYLLKENQAVTVNLPEQIVITAGGKYFDFQFDAFRKYCILNGLHDLDYILAQTAAIRAFRRRQEEALIFAPLDPRSQGGRR